MVGRWCSQTVMKRYDHCMGCMAQWRQNFEVQRTIKRAELTVDNKGIVDGLRKGESKCTKPRAGDADLWYKNVKNYMVWQKDAFWWKWSMYRRTAQKRKKKNMSQFERFVTEGNEKADELAKTGAMLDKGFMAEARAETMQQEREEVYAALQYAASFHCLKEQCKEQA